VLAFEGQRHPSSLTFVGSDLKSKYDPAERTYYVAGEGVRTGETR
jgi:hypothetical protein